MKSTHHPQLSTVTKVTFAFCLIGVFSVVYACAFMILSKNMRKDVLGTVTRTHRTGANYFILQAEDYDEGALGYYDKDSQNKGMVYRNNGVDIKSLGTNQYATGWMQTGEWMNYTVSVPRTGEYKITTRSSALLSGRQLKVLVDGRSVKTLTLPTTVLFSNFRESSHSSVSLTQGVHTIRFYVQEQYFDLDWVKFETVIPPTPTPVQYPPEIGSNYFKLQAENYKTGGQNVGYYDFDTQNIGNTYRSDGVDIKQLSSGIYATGWMQNGEWLEYNVNVPTTGVYDVTVRSASVQNNSKLRVSVDGTTLGSFTLPDTNSYDTYVERTYTLSNITAGQRRIRLTVDQQYFDLDWVRFDRRSTVATTPIPTNPPSVPGPTQPPSVNLPGLPSNAVIINPSTSNVPTDYIQDIINSKPSGTTYLLKKGVHRTTMLSPKKDDVIWGEVGAILSGAKLLDSSTAQREGVLYYFSNQTQASEPKPTSGFRGPLPASQSGTGYICTEELPLCNYNEEFFMSNTRLKRVANKSDVVAGSWYFDMDSNRIYIAENPRDRRVEASVTQYAINAYGERENITVRNLIVEKFATPAQRNAVELASNSGLIEFSEVRLNHGGAIKLGDNGVARYNHVHNQGQIGFGGSGKNIIVEFNEVAYNNQSGFTDTWEAGGSKWARSENLIVRNNYSHHNKGPCFWTDIDNKNTKYLNNILTHCTKHGIQHEISFDVEIANNFVGFNGHEVTNKVGKQIYIQLSQNAKVYNNIVVSDPRFGEGIIIHNGNRGDSNLFPGVDWVAKNNQVYNNSIYHYNTVGAASGLEGNSTSDEYPAPHDFNTAASSNNKFYNNQYFIGSNMTTANTVWRWGEFGSSKMGFAQYLTKGQEPGIRVGQTTSVRAIPAWNVRVGQR